MATRAKKSGTRRDPERWNRADEAAAAAVDAGALAEPWALEEPDEDPVEVARRAAYAVALRRARWERAGRGSENAAG
ncbi:hypothetical protein ACFQX6_11530 [Streptosporangium lutulentum]